jgi:LmbE family N-acetylglucosaminyl deacetylase
MSASRWVTAEFSPKLRDADRASCVVVAPHPDDESLGCGGTIARRAARGTPVTVVLATDGGDAEVRVAEVRAAIAALGLTDDDLVVLGFPDGALADHDAELRHALAHVLADRQPDQVLVCSAADAHPDHVALHHATIAVCAELGRPPRVLEYPVWAWVRWPFSLAPAAVEAPTGSRWSRVRDLRRGVRRERPVRVPLGADAVRAKAAAIAAHRSQHAVEGATSGEGLPPSVLACFRGRNEVFLRPWRRDSRPRLAVLSHRADRSGAPSALALALDGLGARLGAEITLVLGAPGVLSARVLVDRLVIVPRTLRSVAARLRTVPRASAAVAARRRAWLQRHVEPVDAVYVNSLLSTPLADAFADHPTIVHVHEVGEFAAASGAPGRALLERAAAVIAVSEAAAAWVADHTAVDPARVHVVPGPVAPTASRPVTTAEVDALRAEWDVPPDAFVVLGVGWFGAMKGSDRFLDVARATRDAIDPTRPVRFVWVGGEVDTDAGRAFIITASSPDLRDIVRSEPGRDDLRVAYALADVVVVASREESLSMVALEGAAAGKPVFAFPGAGGPDELAAHGIVELAADASAMADALRVVAADEHQAVERGARARDAVLIRHDAERSRAAIATIVGDVLTPVRGVR